MKLMVAFMFALLIPPALAQPRIKGGDYDENGLHGYIRTYQSKTYDILRYTGRSENPEYSEAERICNLGIDGRRWSFPTESQMDMILDELSGDEWGRYIFHVRGSKTVALFGGERKHLDNPSGSGSDVLCFAERNQKPNVASVKESGRQQAAIVSNAKNSAPLNVPLLERSSGNSASPDVKAASKKMVDEENKAFANDAAAKKAKQERDRAKANEAEYAALTACRKPEAFDDCGCRRFFPNRPLLKTCTK